MRVCQFRHFGTGWMRAANATRGSGSNTIVQVRGCNSQRAAVRFSLFAVSESRVTVAALVRSDHSGPSTPRPEAKGEERKGVPLTRRLGGLAGALRAVFLQLVVQRLQADAQNFCGASLVVVGGLQRFQNEQTLSLTDGGADPQTYGVRLLDRGAWNDLAEARGQVLHLDHGAIANNRGAFQCVAQLADISRPRV